MQQYNLLTYYSQFNFQTHWNGDSLAIDYKVIQSSLGDRYKALREKTKNNRLQNDSTIWFSPFTEFPLYKFKDYVDNNNVNITRSKKLNNTVDTVILNDSIIQKYFNIDTTHHRKDLFYIIDKKFYDERIKSSVSVGNRRYTNNTTQDYVLLSGVQTSNIKTKIKSDIESFSSIEGYIVGNEWGSAKAFQYTELFEQIINEYEQGNINIVFDTQINNDVNGGLEFDEDLFSTLLDMIGNNDEGNINIAREIIASTNLNESRPYVLYLFHLYPGLVRQNNTKSWKYVVDQFKDDKNRLCYDHLQMFLNVLGTKYPEYIPIIFKLMVIYFNKQWKNEVIKEITIV